jgi:hypothetical protein
MIATGRVSGRRLGFGALIATIASIPWSASHALVLVTSDPGLVAAFQAGATVESFDSLQALAITSYASGQTVPPANQFSSSNTAAFTAPFFNSGGASFNDPVANPGTPIGIFDPDGGIASEVVSGANVAGPLAGGSDQAFNFGFMEVIFPADMQRVGLWVTHGTIQMFLKDATNTNLASGDVSATGNAGQFIGISRDAADVRGVTMGFPESFTIDDFTYANTPIPEPASAGLAALAVGLVVVRARIVARGKRGARW